MKASPFRQIITQAPYQSHNSQFNISSGTGSLSSPSAVSPRHVLHTQCRHNAHSLLRQEINEQRTWPVISVRLEDYLTLLIPLYALKISIKQVR